MSVQLWEGMCYHGTILVLFEGNAGNMDRAVKHWMISAGTGKDSSLGAIRRSFMNGNTTKDDFEKALRAHKEANDEMKSEQRETAAAVYFQHS